MTDLVPPHVRSRIMSAIRGKNTKIELGVRKALFGLGYRYRLHARSLPGKPDIVLPKHHAVIFVNGCFWHGHNCSLFRLPKTNTGFWRHKIATNRKGDTKALLELAAMGWRTFTVWECSLRGKDRNQVAAVCRRLDRWIRSRSVQGEVRG
jgi:DNA mismatch endonuclease (patch repair protein)